MSHSSFAAAFEPAEHLYKMQVMAATWGHLAPIKNKTYKGHIVWALDLYDSGYLNPKILAMEINVTDSPWFFNAMIDFLQDIHEKMFSADRKSFWGPSDREIATAGTIWRWDGTFRNYVWKGTVRQLFCEGLSKPAPVTKTTKTKKDFEQIAAEIRAMPKKQAKARMESLMPELKASNPKFNPIRFMAACGL